MASVPEIPPELLPYEGILDVRFLCDTRLPLQRRVWLSEQYKRGEVTLDQLGEYVRQYLAAPETVAPAGESIVQLSQPAGSGAEITEILGPEIEGAPFPVAAADPEPQDPGVAAEGQTPDVTGLGAFQPEAPLRDGERRDDWPEGFVWSEALGHPTYTGPGEGGAGLALRRRTPREEPHAADAGDPAGDAGGAPGEVLPGGEGMGESDDQGEGQAEEGQALPVQPDRDERQGSGGSGASDPGGAEGSVDADHPGATEEGLPADPGQALVPGAAPVAGHAGAGEAAPGAADLGAAGHGGAPGVGAVPGDQETQETASTPDGSVEGEAPAIVLRLHGSPHIPLAKKEELASRFDAGTLNETMLRVLIESYEDEANDQTEESDEPPPEREPLPEPFLQAIADRQPQPTQGTLSMEPTEISPEMAEAIPVLTTAAALLPPDEEEIPPPPSESLPPPPGQAFGNFHVEKGRYGPNTWGVDILHPSGEYEPVMIFLQREHPDWDGPTIGQWLMNNGLPQELAVRLGRQRQGALEGVAVAVHFPAVAQLSENEERHYAEKDAFSRAFIAAQQKKTKDSK